MLWKTNLVSDGYSNELRRVFPFMAYAAWDNMGKSSGGYKEFSTLDNNYHFQMYKDFQISKPNIISFPKFRKSNVGENFKIVFVMKFSDATIVTIRKTGCLQWYSISPLTYLECNGKEYLIREAKNIRLGLRIRKECGTRYFNLVFPPIPSNIQSVNIFEDIKNGFFWESLSIN
jgi:hypothetical protein